MDGQPFFYINKEVEPGLIQVVKNEIVPRLKEMDFACLTYHKYPKEDWSIEEFSSHNVQLVTGEVVEIGLVEHGTWLGK